MKRFALAGLLALAATFAAQESASAGGFSCGGSIGLKFNFTCNWCCPCPSGCCGYGYAAPAPTYGYGYDASAYYPAYAAQNYGNTYYAGPAVQPGAPAVAQPMPTTMQVGYYPYAYNYYGYQAPNYWYGR
jgi:hypothetical protein